MSSLRSLVSLLATCWILCTAPALAGPLTGATLSGTGLLLAPSVAVVGPGVEFDITGSLAVDFNEDGQLTMTVHDSNNLFFSGAFNYVFTDALNAIPDFTGFNVVSLGAGTTGFGQGNLSFTTNTFTVNLDGSRLFRDQPNVLQLSFGAATVPEPASLALVGLALAAAGVASRRRKAGPDLAGLQ